MLDIGLTLFIGGGVWCTVASFEGRKDFPFLRLSAFTLYAGAVLIAAHIVHRLVG
jgi:hypothetical protein